MRRQGGIFLILSGLVAIQLALLSGAIGLDNDPGWGRGRILLLMVGIFIGLTGGAVFFWSRLKPQMDRADLWIAQIETSIRSKLAGAMIVTTASTLLRNALGSPWLAWSLSDRKRRSATAAWLAFILSTLAILWYATAGRMTTWNPYWHAYYNKLADAFLAGQVALLEQPDSSLTALADPYPFENRVGASYLWDVSFYRGHFHLYWGPAPGVILAAIKFITHSLIEDQALVVGFMIGIAGVMAWLIFAMRRRFFPNSSPFLQLLLTVACSLNLYFMWIIGRPGVYEAAILGGQFYPVKAVAMM